MIGCPASGFGVAYGYYWRLNSLALHLMANFNFVLAVTGIIDTLT